MRKLTQTLTGMQQRFQSARPGSVMILVVTLLVLMALIGTAYLTTAHGDRFAAQQHAANTQVDMYLDSVKQMVLARIIDSTRTAWTPNSGITAYPWGPDPQRWNDVHTDDWLASRVPTTVDEACGIWAPTRIYARGEWVKAAVGGPYYVSRISNNVNNALPSGLSSNPAWLVDPVTSAPPSGPNTGRATLVWEAVSSPVLRLPTAACKDVRNPTSFGAFAYDGAVARYLVQLTSISIGGTTYPAFRFYTGGDPLSATPTDGFEVALAGSASGNGIPDSFMCQLPVGEINGITYYAAVRIIDDNSAVNLNTAGSALMDFNGAGAQTLNLGIFPGNIGLAELLPFDPVGSTDTTNGADFMKLNHYRNTGQILPVMDPNQYLRPDGIMTSWTSSNTRPQSDDPANTPRPDFRYLSEADAQFMGLGRRLDRPGPSLAQGGNILSFHSLSWTDSAAIAYGGDLVNPTAAQNGTVSTVEQLMAGTLVAGYRQTPWDLSDPNAILNWYGQNYAYGFNPYPANAMFNRRPLLVTRNPVSNLMPQAFATNNMTALQMVEQFYNTNNVYNAGNPNRMTVDLLNEVGYWLPMNSPELSNPPPIPDMPRVALNTAPVSGLDVLGPFPRTPTLWIGFFNAMANALNPPYAAPSATAWQLQPWANYSAAQINEFLTGGPNNPYPFLSYQFRSSLRDLNGLGPWAQAPQTGSATPPSSNPTSQTYFLPREQLLLRSLLAAVNAKDMRDSDDDVTLEMVQLPAAVNNTAPGTAMVATAVEAFGVERQPFITEVYVNNDTSAQAAPATIPNPNDPNNPLPNPHLGKANPKGYVAVELYNPYDIPINLSDWTVGLLLRTGTGVTVSPIMDQTGHPVNFTNIIMAPGTHLVLENFDGGNPTTTGTATYRPWDIYSNPDPSTNKNFRAFTETVNAASGNADGIGNNNSTSVVNIRSIYVPNLETVIADPIQTPATPGGELVLLRPRLAAGATYLAPGVTNAAILSEKTAQNAPYDLIPSNMVPVDSFDFTGMSLTATTKFSVYHYVRSNAIPNATAVATPTAPQTVGGQYLPNWKFVYPGHWNPNYTPTHQDGVATVTWDTAAAPPGNQDPWIDQPPGWTATPPASGGMVAIDGLTTAPINLSGGDFASSYRNPYPPIQLNNTGFGNPAPGTNNHGANKNFANNAFNVFPFGGFARAGDVTQVPYIGSYVIRNATTGAMLEMNPVTIDSSFADDGFDTVVVPTPQLNEDQTEQLGRLCPMNAARPDLYDSFLYDSKIGAFAMYNPANQRFVEPVFDPANGTVTTPFPQAYPRIDRSGWAKRVLDCFSTIQTPNDDYLPNTDPYLYGSWDPIARVYPAALLSPIPIPNSPKANVFQPPQNGGPNGSSEFFGTVDGLININTAPVRVLMQVPWVVPGQTGPTGLPQQVTPAQAATWNQLIAASIVNYRNSVGPFKSLFDLNNVPIPNPTDLNNPNPGNPVLLQLIDGDPTIADYDVTQGDLTPNFVGRDGIAGDVKQQLLEVTRLSNILTTRSDTFTVYIDVQGWRGVGTANPTLAVERRAAFIADRSGMTPTNRNVPKPYTVSTN